MRVVFFVENKRHKHKDIKQICFLLFTLRFVGIGMDCFREGRYFPSCVVVIALEMLEELAKGMVWFPFYLELHQILLPIFVTMMMISFHWFVGKNQGPTLFSPYQLPYIFVVPL